MQEQSNHVAGEAVDPAEEPAFITPRRLIRWAAVVGVAIVAVLACWQDPSYAHEADGRSGAAGALLPVGGAATVLATVAAASRRNRRRA